MGRPRKNIELGQAVLDTLGPGPWPETAMAAVYGMSQQAVNQEIRRILAKLRRHGEFIAAQQGVRITGPRRLLELLGEEGSKL